MAAKSSLDRFLEMMSEKTGQNLRPHQRDGIEFMVDCWKNGHGCILADEMGLGKTCQALVMLRYLMAQKENGSGVYLVICPLSVLDHWKGEAEKFGDCLDVMVYHGDKEEREKLRERLLNDEDNGFRTILTTYEIVMKDAEFFSRWSWTAVVIDEAHRLKNMDSVLHDVMANQIKSKWTLLLTGTPVQNNLNELYSLLSLCHPDEFPPDTLKRFVERFSDTKNEKTMKKLREVMQRYILRRTKDVVGGEMPSKSEVILFHDITDLQKELYKAILMKNYDMFEQGASNRGKQSLMNTLVQLRKCVGHPYLFDGIEPEPFEQGEHLVEASGKLLILDALLSFLKKHGHKVLLFSQMTRMLDVVQDYLTYRDYSYERLDGSVRGEERFAAVKRFANAETFCFLLSTRAGGLGLNLVAADTVIFLDSDFNPQNDLQAAARAHRMGQKRHVKIIRLVGRRTVEEIILARAASKLKFTNTILYERSDEIVKALSASEINEMLMFGLSEMRKGQKSNIGQSDLAKMLGKSQSRHWIEPDDEQANDWVNDVELENIYTFEGKDYREETKQADREAFNTLKVSRNEILDKIGGIGKNRGGAGAAAADILPRQKKEYTELERQEMREKRRLAAEKRKQTAEENRIRKEEERKARVQKLWKENDYHSSRLLDTDDSEDEEDNPISTLADDDGSTSSQDPIFVSGDVTKPDIRQEHKSRDVIVVHCVDDSGSWGRGGVFNALSSLSSDIESHYELTKTMKDLSVGDVHLIEVKKVNKVEDRKTLVALIVAQSHEQRHDIKLDALENGLKRIGFYAAKNNCTVHMPRIGYGMASFNWYTTERLIRKLLCRRGIPTYIYYFPRNLQRKRRQIMDEDADSNDSASHSDKESDGNQGASTKPKRMKNSHDTSGIDDQESIYSTKDLPYLPSVFNGYNFYFHESIPNENVRRLRRFVIAYGGQDTKLLDGTSNDACTHVVVENDSSKDAKIVASGKEMVTREWLDKCIKAKKLLPLQ